MQIHLSKIPQQFISLDPRGLNGELNIQLIDKYEFNENLKEQVNGENDIVLNPINHINF